MAQLPGSDERHPPNFSLTIAFCNCCNYKVWALLIQVTTTALQTLMEFLFQNSRRNRDVMLISEDVQAVME